MVGEGQWDLRTCVGCINVVLVSGTSGFPWSASKPCRGLATGRVSCKKKAWATTRARTLMDRSALISHVLMYPHPFPFYTDHPAPLTMPVLSSRIPPHLMPHRHALIWRSTKLTPLTHAPNPKTGNMYPFRHALKIDARDGNDFMLDGRRCSTRGIDHERVSSSPFSSSVLRSPFSFSCDG